MAHRVVVRNLCTALNKMTQRIKLNDGNQIPVIGLGTFKPIGFPSDPIIIDALETGFRHFDTAYFYENQEELGAALKKGLEKHKLNRNDVFVTTKVWNTFHKKESAIQNCRTNLDKLQLDHVDLLLIHSPIAYQEGAADLPMDKNGKILLSDVDYLETWEGLEECVKRGWTKSIGVSNFSIEQLQRVLDNCKVKPSVNQVEAHPYFNQDALLKFCKKNDIILEAYAPLGAPYDTNPHHEDVHVLEDPIILEIAKKHQKTPAQVLLHWAIQRGTVPLPRTTKKHRLEENFGVFDFQLTEDDMQQIGGLDKNLRAYKY